MSYIPKVGEECITPSGKGTIMCGPDAVGAYCIDIDNVIHLYHSKSLKPLKTPAEIERENSINEAAKMFDHLTGIVSPFKLAKIVIDNGYSNKKTHKSLTRTEFIFISESERWSNDVYEKVKGCFIEGGE